VQPQHICAVVSWLAALSHVNFLIPDNVRYLTFMVWRGTWCRGKAFALWSWDHWFKFWKQSLIKMQKKIMYIRPKVVESFLDHAQAEATARLVTLAAHIWLSWHNLRYCKIGHISWLHRHPYLLLLLPFAWQLFYWKPISANLYHSIILMQTPIFISSQYLEPYWCKLLKIIFLKMGLRHFHRHCTRVAHCGS
jgi:hypothetical protein